VAFLAPAAGIAFVFIGLLIVVATGGAADEGTVQARVLYAGLALMLGGSVVFAAVAVSTGILSRVAAGLIVIGVPPTTLGLVYALTPMWLVLGGIVFGLGWIGLGLNAIRRDRRPVSAGPAAA
jgi:hypothetical protein